MMMALMVNGQQFGRTVSQNEGGGKAPVVSPKLPRDRTAHHGDKATQKESDRVVHQPTAFVHLVGVVSADAKLGSKSNVASATR